MMLNLPFKPAAVGLLLVGLSGSVIATEYNWDTQAPIKTPTPALDNGKRVLFDVSHGGTEGNADWVIDGGFSDFAYALVAEGYTVEEYRGVDLNGDGRIAFVDDYNTPANVGQNEAIISYDAISHADVLVLAETNRPFTVAEYAALKQFVDAGKGIFFIADHYDADRNLNTWDATEVYNGYNRSDLAKYNLHAQYGDMRNPKSATQGWLAEHFGLRFRFNAADYKSGVSGVVAASQSEGITAGVDPILMAAGATLAITDPTLAKGIVYFAASDNPSAWSYAKDDGLYFGGAAEGPYVAIAKPSAGKAAFIGDSSPIEDATPKYRRQDSGNTKSTYPGWTDPGHASVLAVNIINWLATPESYVGFGSSTHPAGTATPTPMDAQEMSDPNAGEPWSQPSGGYNPWDPATFADGAYGAPCPIGGCSGSGGSTGGESLSVSAALASAIGSAMVVEGVIQDELNGIYALLLADDNDASTTINVKLESSQRQAFSPNLNPALIGQRLRVTGVRDTYLSGPSIESVSDLTLLAEDDGNGSSGTDTGTDLSVIATLAQATGTDVAVRGVVVDALNGIYALLLGDLSDPNTTINIKLEADQRDSFSPNLNPDILGQTIRVVGKRDTYMSGASVEYVTTIEVVE